MPREKKKNEIEKWTPPFSVLLAPTFKYHTIRISLLIHIVHNLPKWHVVSSENENKNGISDGSMQEWLTPLISCEKVVCNEVDTIIAIKKEYDSWDPKAKHYTCDKK